MRRRTLLVVLAGMAMPVLPGPGREACAQTGAAPFGLMVARAAAARAEKPEVYDPSYRRIAYPMGDVPDDRGVCTDTVIRAFRAAGVDLQALVHEDMRRAFTAYPQTWGLTRPDANIDHRRVPNLETFFARAGARLDGPPTATAVEAGDLISWRLTGTGLPHIGVALDVRREGRALIAHNIGAGTQIEDVLFAWPIKGWFRWPGRQPG
jgi:hypothetical protein